MEKESVIHSNPNILGGTPVFVGTRVPVQTLLDYLEGGESLDTFLDHFPTVRREQTVAALELAKPALVHTLGDHEQVDGLLGLAIQEP